MDFTDRGLLRYLIVDYDIGINKFSKFKNNFEIALESDYNFISDIRSIILDTGEVYAALSGSGSTMFGIYSNFKEAENARKVISENSTYKLFTVKPIDEFPKIIKGEFAL